MSINLTPHLNYEGKSWPATLVDEIATPLRWAAGEGKIDIKNNSVTETPLSNNVWIKNAYIIAGQVIVFFEIITVVPFLATWLAQWAIVRWDKNAKTASDAYQNSKISTISAKILNNPLLNQKKQTHVPIEKNSALLEKKGNPEIPTSFPSSESLNQEKQTTPSIQHDENITYTTEVSDALSRLKLTKKEGDLFTSESGKINLREFILNQTNTDWTEKFSIMTSSQFNFSGVAREGINTYLICRTVEDMNDLTLIAQSLYPEEAKALIFAQDELRRFKTVLKEHGFPVFLLEQFSLYATILKIPCAFGDKRRDDLFVRTKAATIMYRSVFPFRKMESISRWPLSCPTFENPNTKLKSFEYGNCTFTSSQSLHIPLSSSLEEEKLCINDQAPGFYSGLFPIGMHLVMCDDDDRTAEDRRKDLGEMAQFLTTIQEEAKEFYKYQTSNNKFN